MWRAKTVYACFGSVAGREGGSQPVAGRIPPHLRAGKRIPGWYSFPEVVRELRKAIPPRHGQGFTVFLTGFSGAGKSTIAKVLYARFLEIGGRPVTLLDGDIVRQQFVERTRLFQGTPRYQCAPNRVCGQ